MSRGSLTRSSVALGAVEDPGATAAHREWVTGAAAAIFAAAALTLGFGVRLLPVMAASFPLNDGGMFFRMIEDLRRSHFALPSMTSYNGGSVPYAYPPLGFYVGAAVSSLPHVDPLTVVRVLPAVVSCLTLIAFYRLARTVVASGAAVAALFAFALLPGTYQWEIMGGGLTRSFGLLFAVLALNELYVMLARRETRRAVPASLLCGLTLLSHIEFGWFLAFSAAFFVVVFARTRHDLVRVALVAGGTLLTSAPWWLTVLLRDGLAPIRAAGQSGGTFSPGITLSVFAQLNLTQESLFAPLLILGVIGILVCLRDRRFLLPGWIVVCLLLDPRTYFTDVTLPFALLAGVGVDEFLIPFLRAQATPDRDAGPGAARGTAGQGRLSSPRWLAPGVLGAAVMYSLFAAIGTPTVVSTLTPLPAAEQVAMAWAATNTPPDSRFLVISGESWAVDRSAEWFPALAGRVSVATVQGSEWLPNGGFAGQLSRDRSAQACAVGGSACLTAWVRGAGTPFDYVYVNRRPPVREYPALPTSDYHWALEYALRAAPGYRVVYAGPGAVIFAVVHSASVLNPPAFPAGSIE